MVTDNPGITHFRPIWSLLLNLSTKSPRQLQFGFTLNCSFRFRQLDNSIVPYAFFQTTCQINYVHLSRRKVFNFILFLILHTVLSSLNELFLRFQTVV